MRENLPRMLIVTFLSFAIFLVVTCGFVSSSFSSTISNIPSDQKIHSYVEELGRRGLLRNFSFSNRPYTRENVVKGIALLDDAVSSGKVKLDPYEAWLVERLREEFQSFQLGAELEGIGKSRDHEVTLPEDMEDGVTEDNITKSRESLRGIFSAWAEFDAPHGISLAHRFRIDTRIPEDPGFLGQVWKDDVGGYVANAYGKLSFGPIGVLLGRDKLYWGPGKSGSLILSDAAPPFDMVCFSLNFGRVTATGFFTTLDDMTLAKAVPYGTGTDSLRAGDIASRHLSGHRLDVRISRDLQVGLSETVVYGGADRGLDPGYINPLNFFYAQQWNIDKNDNPMWSVDAIWWPKERLQVYGQLLVDDYQFEQKSRADEEPPEIGFLLGLHSGDPFGLVNTSFTLEYARVNPWTYNQPLPWNRYTYGKTLLGHPLGPDADAVYLSVTKWLNEKFTFELDYRFARDGETSVYTDWPVPPVGPWGGASFPDGSFPLGVASKSHMGSIRASFHPTLHLDVDGFASVENVSDYQNIEGASLSNLEIGLSVSFRPDWAFGR
jgi:hypothetical protein